MQEQLISFKTAKLAKEKGFKPHVAYFEKCYDKHGDTVPVIDVTKYIDNRIARRTKTYRRWK